MKVARETIVAGLLLFPAVFPDSSSAQNVVPDPALKAVVLSALGRASGAVAQADMLSLTNGLFAQFRNITNLAGLNYATNLKHVYLTGNGISDVTPLQGLIGLTDLELDRNSVTNLSPLTGLTNLVSLVIGQNPLNDVSPISHFTHLASFSLCQGYVSDLTVFTNLAGLTNLSLYSDGLIDISPIVSLTNLASLDLRFDDWITNLALLAGSTNLVRLSLGYNPDAIVAAGGLGFLSPLTRLGFLNLESDGLGDLSGLSSLTNLNYLSLSYNVGTATFQSGNSVVLGRLTGLANLEMRNNALSSMDFATNLARLTFADFSYNSLTNLDSLTRLSATLNSVNFSGNPAANFTNSLPSLAHLTNLWIFDDSIGSLGFLTNMTQLACLGLDGNPVTDLSPLVSLKRLNLLSLSRVPAAPVTVTNPAGYYGSISSLTNLGGLWLEGNSLTNMGFLSGFNSLRNLGVRTNRLANLSFAAGFSNLETLYAGANLVSNVTSLASFVDASSNLLPHLARVDLFAHLLGNAATNWNVLSTLRSRGVETDYLPLNQLTPSIPAMLLTPATWYIPANQTSTLNLNISEALGLADTLNYWPILSVNGTNSVQSLLTNSLITITGTNSALLLTVTPSVNRTGNSVLTVNAQLGGLFVSTNILLSVQVASNIVLEVNLSNVISADLGYPAHALTSVDLLNLPFLSGPGASLTNLSGLEWASNLTGLYLGNNGITDLVPLRNMSGLSYLSLFSNLVSDASPLSGLTNLGFLDLSWNPITNSSAIAGLVNLTSLSLAGDSITNLNFLTNLTRLVTLDLSFNRLTDISPLLRLTNLATVYLDQNHLTNVGPLTNLPALAYLDVSDNLLDTNALAFGTNVTLIASPQRGPPCIDVRTNWLITLDSDSALPLEVSDTNGPAGEQWHLGAVSSRSNFVLGWTNLLLTGTNTLLTLDVTNLSLADESARITFSATNDLGLAATVTVFVQATSLTAVTNFTFGDSSLVWKSGGDAPWFGQDLVTDGGAPAAQSGVIGNFGDSWLETTVQGPGVLSFWWKVSSETNYDFLHFTARDAQWHVVASNSISGEVDWQQQTVNLPGFGTQTLRWWYSKDNDDSDGWDAAWLSGVTFAPSTWLEMLGGITNGKCSFLIHASSGRPYEVLVSTNLSAWSSLSSFTASSDTTLFQDTNATARVQFYRLHTLPQVNIWIENLGIKNGMFQLALHSPPSLQLDLQTSTPQMAWYTLATLTNTTGRTVFTDTQALSSTIRFYRLRISQAGVNVRANGK